MRGVIEMQSSFSELEYAAKQKVTRRDRFLAEIEAITPWAELERTVAPFYPSNGGRGRPPIGLSRMLRMYVVQQCFGLSDEGIEDALYDSQAIRRFVGIDLSRESAPDATTLLKFRRLLETHQLTESIFNAINAHLAKKRGCLLRWRHSGEGFVMLEAHVLDQLSDVPYVGQCQFARLTDKCDIGHQGRLSLIKRGWIRRPVDSSLPRCSQDRGKALSLIVWGEMWGDFSVLMPKSKKANQLIGLSACFRWRAQDDDSEHWVEIVSVV